MQISFKMWKNFNKNFVVGVLIFILKSCAVNCESNKNLTRLRRSLVDPYGSPPFAPFGAVPSFGSFFPPSLPSFPPPPFPPSFPTPLGPPIPLPSPPMLPSPFPSLFPLPFYPPSPPSAYPYPYPPPAPPPPPPPPPPAAPAPTPIILPAHTAATLSVASLLHALIAKKFYPPVVPFPVPRPVPFPVTVKIPVPVPIEQPPQHVTILKPANHIEEAIHYEVSNHDNDNEWHSSPPNEWHSSPPDDINLYQKH